MNDEMTKKVLVRAAELVERGWCQGTLGTRVQWTPQAGLGCYRVGISHPAGLVQADRVCLDGALMLATHEVTGEGLDKLARAPAYRAAGDAIKVQVARVSLVGGLCVGLPSYVAWNDAAGRTAEEVAAVCRKAAE